MVEPPAPTTTHGLYCFSIHLEKALLVYYLFTSFGRGKAASGVFWISKSYWRNTDPQCTHLCRNIVNEHKTSKQEAELRDRDVMRTNLTDCTGAII